MNIIEAVKSGRPFRRKGVHVDWMQADYHCFCQKENDILADDWEIQEEKVTITRGEFHRRFTNVWSDIEGVGAKRIVSSIEADLFDDKP